jgi:superfamily II DNA or RNA helicase
MTPYKFQQTAIEKLTESFKKLWRNHSDRTKTIVFKSPTGSGKTYMTASLVNALNQQPDWDEDKAFVWITFSDDLAMQSRDKFFQYFSPNLSNQLLTVADIDRQGILKKNDVLFLNWQKLVSEKASNRNLRRPEDSDKEKEQGFYFEDMIENTHKEGRAIVLIIDESHKNVTSSARRDVIDPLKCQIILKVSATPENIPSASDVLNNLAGYVEVNREDVVNEGLIKARIECQTEEEIKSDSEKDLDTLLIDLAMKKREELALQLKDEGVNVNPLVLIQLPDDKKIQKEIAGLKSKEEIVCDHLHQMRVTDEKIARWFDSRKENMERIAENDNEVEYMLFKQAAGTGWDCPRAQILVMYRDIASPTFHTQTIGRILRVPATRTEDRRNVLKTGYLYTNYQRNEVSMPEPSEENQPKVYTAEMTNTHKKELAITEIVQRVEKVIGNETKEQKEAIKKVTACTSSALEKVEQLEIVKQLASNVSISELKKKIAYNDIFDFEQKIKEAEAQHQRMKEDGKLQDEIIEESQRSIQKGKESLQIEIKKQIEEIGQKTDAKTATKIADSIRNGINALTTDSTNSVFIIDENLTTEFLSRADYGDLQPADEFQKEFIKTLDRYFKIPESECSYSERHNRIKGEIDLDSDLTNPLVVNAILDDLDEVGEELRRKDNGKDTDYRISTNDVEKIFTAYCPQILAEQTEEKAKVGNVARSWSTLKTSLRLWMSTTLGQSSDTCYRIFINDVRKEGNSIFRKCITQALINFYPIRKEYIAKKELQQTLPFAIHTTYGFTQGAEMIPGLKRSLINPFYIEKKIDNEIRFIHFIDECEHVAWWYKNGDKGKDHLALRYENSTNDDVCLFYPDWIIKFDNGTIGIYDTKAGITANSPETKDKAEALQKWLEKLNKTSKSHYAGGIIVNADGKWMLNSNTNYTYNSKDLKEWTPFE